MPTRNSDRNLLFGIIALQMDFILEVLKQREEFQKLLNEMDEKAVDGGK